MARLLYTLLFTALLPFMLFRLFRRSLRNPAYRRRISERFGSVANQPPAGTIWIHSVSVGETVASQPLVERLLSRFPDRSLLITTTTPTGSAQVKRQFGDRVFHTYLPYDLPWFWNRFFKQVQPELLIVMETELWPNLLAHCNKAGVPTVLANARLSEKSARGYRKFSALTRPMLNSLSAIGVQNSTDGDRFVDLGYPRERITDTGSIKFDISVSNELREQGRQLRHQWGEERPVLALASSHEGEDELLLDCYHRLASASKGLILMIIPRHPERFDQVVAAAETRDLRVHRRTEGPVSFSNAESLQVYVADTMGEMMLLLSATDVVVMGGSFEPVGGHNPIEPASLGKPVLMGPHYFNFATIVANLEARGALKVTSAARLNQDLMELLGDDRNQQAMARAAISSVSAHRGAIDRLEKIVVDTLDQSGI